MGDENNGMNLMTTKSLRISKKFIRAIDKHGIMINLMVLKSGEPTNEYELLYGQSKFTTDKDLQFKALLILNPSDDVYKDYHLHVNGDAVLGFMSYSMEQNGIIKNTLSDYLSIPRQLIGNHVRIGDDYYRVDDCNLTAIYQGFPLYVACSLAYVETKAGGGD